MKDLFVLVADADMKAVMEVLLKEKYQYQLGIKKLDFEIYRHPKKDSGVRKDSVEIFLNQYSEFYKGLVMLDYDGSGFKDSPQELEKRIKEDIIKYTSWSKKNVEVIVIYPEIEIWVWGVADKFPEIFHNKDIPRYSGRKPLHPKEEFEKILRKVGRSLSPGLFEEIARKVSRHHIDNCRDRAFRKLVDTLRGWFGVSSS